MNALSHGSTSRLGRLSSWLGKSASGDDAANRCRDADRDLFAQIGDFLADHDLAPTEAHFAIARHYVLGDDLRLNRAIDRHLDHYGALDAAFLAQWSGASANDGLAPERIAAMADALAGRLAESERTFHQSHASARDYQSALAAEVGTADRDPDATMKRLLSLTSEAIDRTRALASQLEETHRETTRLRDNLEEARRAAEEDHLTGLPNRRCFDGRLHALANRTPDDGVHCVALCDIDDFKAINDRHGHDTGDRVLKLVARQLTGELGLKVLVARHGGEEFACLFEDHAPDAAKALLDDVRERLGARALVNQASGEGIGCISFSAGVAVFGGDPSTTMRSADAALYAAKHAGKNRVIIAAPADDG